jgi:uncharacterized surface protein with fasciclin (FAS1) repeats
VDRARLFAAVALAAVLALAARATAADQKTVGETVAASRDHTILLVALTEAGLTEMLDAKGPLTLFAPTDAAFKKLGEEKLKELVKDRALLKKIVQAHVVTGNALYAKDLAALGGKELNGFTVASNKDGLTLGGAKVNPADVKCSNGVIHVIDAVLMPK